MAYRAAVVGASGYTGAELLRLLEGHPSIDAVVATSREFAGKPVAEVYPNLTTSLRFSAIEDEDLESVDLVFLALPHGASMREGVRLAGAGVRVVDLSADFRLDDPAAYPEWFGEPHVAPDSLSSWVYGLPEIHRDSIRGASSVANPGCYPTAALLALAPLVDAKLIDTRSIVISAASGVSGAGRGANAGVHFSHVDANFKSYGLPKHKHTPEIEQELSRLCGSDVTVTFIPHLVPMVRGLLATCVATLTGDAAPHDVAASYFEGEPFVQVMSNGSPETKYTAGSNRALLAYSVDARTNRVIASAAIDNLGKGAAGQAIQNANLMLGIEETAGLGGLGIYP